MSYLSSSKRSSVHLSKSGIRVLPTLRKTHRPNGIFLLDGSSASDRDSLGASDLSSSSSFSSDGWSNDEFEDPLWVKDDNLRPARRQRRSGGSNAFTSTSPPSPSSSHESGQVSVLRESSADHMIIEEDRRTTENEGQKQRCSFSTLVMPSSPPSPPSPARCTTTETLPRANVNKKKRVRPKGASKNSGSTIERHHRNPVFEEDDEQEASYREFLEQLGSSAMDSNTIHKRTSSIMAKRRQRTVSVNITPRAHIHSSASSSFNPPTPYTSSSSSVKTSPHKWERQRRRAQVEMMQRRGPSPTGDQRYIPSPMRAGSHHQGPSGPAPKKYQDARTDNFFLKKMREVKAYFSSSSSPTMSLSPRDA